MNAAERRKMKVKEIKVECRSKVKQLDRLKAQTLQEVDKICSAMIKSCELECSQLEGLNNIQDVRDASLTIEKRVTRLSNFLSDLPLWLLEQKEKDEQHSASDVCNTVEAATEESAAYDFEELFRSIMGDCSPPSSQSVQQLTSSADEPCFQLHSPVRSENHNAAPQIMLSRKAKPICFSDPEQHSLESGYHPNVSSSENNASSDFLSNRDFKEPKARKQKGETQSALLIASKTPSVFKFSEPCEVDAVVCHVDSPNLFFVQLKSRMSELNRLDSLMTHYCLDYEKLSPENIPGPAIVYDRKFRNFFRAYVRKRIQEKDTVAVKYIDWGNADLVPLSDCYELPEKLGEPCSGAVPCCLQNPQDIFSHVDYNWPTSANSAFRKAYHNHNVTLQVLRAVDNDSSALDPYLELFYDVSVRHKNVDAFHRLFQKNFKPLDQLYASA